MPGRRPKPTALHILDGNARHLPKSKLDYSHEWNPKRAIPEMPKTLPKAAKREWKRIVDILYHEKGVLTVADGKALAAYCYAWSALEAAQKCINEHGDYIRASYVDEKTGVLVVGDLKSNPAKNDAFKALKLMHTFLIEFGMTPASRTKIKTNTGDSGDSSLDSMLSDAPLYVPDAPETEPEK